MRRKQEIHNSIGIVRQLVTILRYVGNRRLMSKYPEYYAYHPIDTYMYSDYYSVNNIPTSKIC